MNMIKLSTQFAKYLAYATACVLFLVACEKKAPPQNLPNFEKKSILSLSRAYYGVTFQADPHFITRSEDSAILRDLLVGLMTFDKKGKVVPGMAREWFSEDGKNWLFILDDKARWSNGAPVTASDFVASWQRLSNPEYQSPLAQYLVYMGVKNAKEIIEGKKSVDTLGVKALNAHTLQIQLTKKNSQLPNMLTHSALLPTYLGQEPYSVINLATNGAYTSFKVEKDSVILKAVKEDTPFQTVEYRLIQVVHNPDRFDIIENPLPTSHKSEIFLPRLCTYFYEFNFKNELMKHKEIRQAIRMMISPAEVSDGIGIPSHTVLPRTMLTGYERYFAQGNAEQMLQKFGITENKPLNITLSYNRGELHSQVYRRLSRSLAQSDLIRVSPQELDWKPLLEKREKGDFQLIRSGWCADYQDPALFLYQFHSQSADNKSGYSNPDVDKLLEDLMNKSLNSTERNKIILDVVQKLEQDVVVIPLFQYQRRLIVDPSVKGIDPENVSEVIYSKDLSR
ncbi:ATPase [Pasteurellaceae bacterium LFhippo2]|nr:ATPase [Pasteurellaceae bacterium LFhippo2]